MDVKTLCLGVLIRGEASGYEIKKQLEDGPLGQFCRAGFGSIYPALGDLGAKGWVTWIDHPQEGRRPGKKIYRITDHGREAFRRALRKRPEADRIHSESLFMLFFSGFLDDGRAGDIAEGYGEVYRRTIERMHRADLDGAPGGCRFVHAIGLAIYEAIVEAVDKNRHLLVEERRDLPTTKG